MLLTCIVTPYHLHSLVDVVSSSYVIHCYVYVHFITSFQLPQLWVKGSLSFMYLKKCIHNLLYFIRQVLKCWITQQSNQSLPHLRILFVIRQVISILRPFLKHFTYMGIVVIAIITSAFDVAFFLRLKYSGSRQGYLKVLHTPK